LSKNSSVEGISKAYTRFTEISGPPPIAGSWWRPLRLSVLTACLSGSRYRACWPSSWRV